MKDGRNDVSETITSDSRDRGPINVVWSTRSYDECCLAIKCGHRSSSPLTSINVTRGVALTINVRDGPSAGKADWTIFDILLDIAGRRS